MSEIRMIKGDTFSIDITASTDGIAVDLSGCELWFTAKESKSDTDNEAIFQKTISNGIEITNAAEGQFSINIRDIDTNLVDLGVKNQKYFYYDMQIKNALGQIYTFNSGKLHIRGDVTRNTDVPVIQAFNLNSDTAILNTISISVSSDAEIA